VPADSRALAPPIELPPLPLEQWRATKDTLHLYAQIVGKVRLATTPLRNQWWNVPLYVDVRGLTTRRMRSGDVSFSIDFDFLDHDVVVRTDRGDVERLALRDGLAVAEFHDRLLGLLSAVGVEVEIRAEPFGVPMTTPFAEDREHASYDADAVHRWWRIVAWVDWVLEGFAGWFSGKSSPVHLFWHSFDLALTRFSGRRAAPMPQADPVTQEAYCEEVISFGFWAGDDRVAEPAFYAYTAPEPASLAEQPLQPDQASWAESGGGHMAVLRYEDVRGEERPEETLLRFLQSAYEAGTAAAGWDADALRSTWCPRPDELRVAIGR
jgi:Family of unknown function (DUF5996)